MSKSRACGLAWAVGLAAPVLLVQASMGGGSPELAQRQTAKADLVKARQAARAWQADAVLISIVGTRVTSLPDREGKVEAALPGTGWSYTFWSNTAKKESSLASGGGVISVEYETKQPIYSSPPILEDFVDSDAAMAAALGYGVKPVDSPEGFPMGIGPCPVTTGETLCWTVQFPGPFAYPILVYVSAKTGKALGASNKLRAPTVKAHLAAVWKTARAWQPDATLLSIDGLPNEAGRAAGWSYLFWSEKASEGLVCAGETTLAVSALPGFSPHYGPLDREILQHPVPEDFADSDQAMAEAIRHGFRPGVGMDMALANWKDPANGTRESLYWVIIIGSAGRPVVTFWVSGKTGTFLGKKPAG